MRGIGHDGAGQRRPLLLSAGQRDAALTDLRVQALRGNPRDVGVELRQRHRIRRPSPPFALRPGPRAPKATLPASVSEKSNGSWGT